ncbi:hypothetical protein B0H94_11095 [Salsuginibacillus halophilus]|uniref:Macro domain-containing protein n=1 Tax=Salsuginibacillus halophilus TaxID=517424 RepID=A0A2P8HBL8_9BACI|nr:hypothetical protein [Salsuginibacillus halophilus]PSL43619.1 hypothetical protein B0H94_11095 [Salsuginibacillus halophilus]
MIQIIQEPIKDFEGADVCCLPADASGLPAIEVCPDIEGLLSRKVKSEAKESCNELQPVSGDIIATGAGALDTGLLVHMVVHQQPGELIRHSNLARALETVVDFCETEGFEDAGITFITNETLGLTALDAAALYNVYLEASTVRFFVADPDQLWPEAPTV